MCTKARIRPRLKAHILSPQKEGCEVAVRADVYKGTDKPAPKSTHPRRKVALARNQNIHEKACQGSGSAEIPIQKRWQTCNPPRFDVTDVHKRRKDTKLRIHEVTHPCAH
jgi:hypothetical protein